jgi:hypothetical protein
MSGNSSVGNRTVYEAGDQVTRSNAEIEQEKKENRFHEGKENSHKALDSSMCLLHSPYLGAPVAMLCQVSANQIITVPANVC